jgi:hypothetical protein
MNQAEEEDSPESSQMTPFKNRDGGLNRDAISSQVTDQMLQFQAIPTPMSAVQKNKRNLADQSMEFEGAVRQE